MIKPEFIIPAALKRDAGIWLPKNVKQMEALGAAAIAMIKRRILTTQRDGTGKPMPRYQKTGWFWTAPNDNRFGGNVKRVSWATGPPADGTRTPVLVAEDGYHSLKRKVAGKAPARRDGNLTGDMWDGLVHTLKRKNDGWVIRLHFKGGTKVGKIQGWGNKTVKKVDADGKILIGEDGKPITEKIKVPKMKTQTLRNRDKAKALQERRGAPVVALLSLTPAEKAQLAQMYAGLIKPFGQSQTASGPALAAGVFR